MSKKQKISVYADDKTIKMDRTIGLKHAVVGGCLCGLMIYTAERFGTGMGVVSILNAFEKGKLDFLSNNEEDGN